MIFWSRVEAFQLFSNDIHEIEIALASEKRPIPNAECDELHMLKALDEIGQIEENSSLITYFLEYSLRKNWWHAVRKIPEMVTGTKIEIFYDLRDIFVFENWAKISAEQAKTLERLLYREYFPWRASEKASSLGLYLVFNGEIERGFAVWESRCRPNHVEEAIKDFLIDCIQHGRCIDSAYALRRMVLTKGRLDEIEKWALRMKPALTSKN